MKIKVIGPFLNPEFDKPIQKLYDEHKSIGTEVKYIHQEKGPYSIESYFDEQFTAPFLFEEITKAENEGYDAIVIFCAGDPAIQGAKELANIPVIGIFEAALHTALLIGRRFSLITITKEMIASQEDLIRLHGFDSRCASIRTINLPVIELNKDRERLINSLYQVGSKCIEDDRADVLVLGCGGLYNVSETLTKKLDVPVIEPTVVGLKYAEMLVELGLSQSKKGWMNPLSKERKT